MRTSITLNKSFLKRSFFRRLWYKFASTNNPAKLEKRLSKRGVESLDLPGIEQREKNRVIKSIITKPPQKVIDELNSQNVGIRCADFFLVEAYLRTRFPFFKYAYAFARAENKVAPNGIIRSAAEFNLNEIKSRTNRFIAEALLRWPLCITGIVLLDFYFLPKMVRDSDYFLGSKYFDHWEASSYTADLALGMVVWGMGFKGEIARKLEPYKYLPVPLVGYWLGRSVEKMLLFSGYVIYKAIKVFYSTLVTYYRLRLYDSDQDQVGSHIVENRQPDLSNWSVQKSLIDRWLKKESAPSPKGTAKRLKALSLFSSIVLNAVENQDGERLSLILDSFGDAELHELLGSIPDSKIYTMLPLLAKRTVVDLFSLFPIDELRGFLSSRKLSREHEKILLCALSSQEAADMFADMSPRRIRQLLALLPDSVQETGPTFKDVLSGMKPEKVLLVLKGIRDKKYLADVCIPALSDEAKLKILSTPLPLEGRVKKIAEKIINGLKMNAATIGLFEEINPERGAELLSLLPSWTIRNKPSLSEIINKIDAGKALRILEQIKDEKHLNSICNLGLTPESRLEIAKLLLSPNRIGGVAAKALFDALTIEQVAALFDEIDPQKAADCISVLFPKYSMARDRLEDIFVKMDEGKALSILEKIASEELLNDIYSQHISSTLRIKLLEYLSPKRAAKILESYPGSVRKEISQAAAAGIGREAALKILTELSSQKNKIDFLRAHCGFEKKKIFEALNDYVCEDGLRLLMAFCEEYVLERETQHVELFELLGEEGQELKKQFVKEMPEISDSDRRKYAGLAEADCNGITSENLKRFMSFLNAEQFRNLILISPEFQALSYALLDAPPSQLVKLAEDYAVGRLRLRENFERSLFNDRNLDYLTEIIKKISPSYLLEFLDRFSDSKKRDILLNLRKDNSRK